ncbi:MAG: ABC transporter ATP-binding protein [Parapedobacter sp.]|nr:MAG: ABC transporter ATP-binding protein [Parapedobacter sp.]
MHEVLEISNLRKRYGYKTVLDIPSHRFSDGLTWIQGKNGSGKSTLLKILAGLLAYGGNVAIGGVNLKKHSIAYRQLIGFSESEARFPPFVTGLDLIRLFKQAKKERSDQPEAFIADFGMADYLRHPIQEYSAGMVKKLSLLLAFIGNPAFIFLDEPYITLDESAMATLASWIAGRVVQGTNVVLTSHQELPPNVVVNDRYVLSEKCLHRIERG